MLLLLIGRPVWIIVAYAIMGALFMPFLAGTLLVLNSRRKFVGELVSGKLATALLWLLFLLALNVALLLVGALMDIFSAIIVVVPLIAPMGLAFGIDPVHLGIIFLVNLELGYLTPPVGMNLFLSSYRFNIPLPQVYAAVVPYLVIRAGGVLLITYIPAITLTLPRLLGM